MMDKSEKTFNKIINAILRIPDKEERMSYMLYYINRLLDTENTFFISKHQIPKRGLTRQAWQERKSFFVNDLSSHDKYDEEYDDYGKDIYSLLFMPVMYAKEYIGLLVSTGKETYTTTEEQMVPLKSGDQTIGVTVKQVTVEVPARRFSDEDIVLIEERLSALINAVHLEKEPHMLHEVKPKKESAEDRTADGILKNTIAKMKRLFGNKN